MKKIIQAAAGVAAAAIVGLAQASTIQIETGHSEAGPQAGADAYRTVVDAALSTFAYGTATVASYDDVSSHALFASPTTHIAFKSTVGFDIPTADAGPWEIRSGVDFGDGGAIFLDGAALDAKSNDMWWHGSYGAPSQIFDVFLSLATGHHTLNIYGLEECCDGGQQAQFRIGDGEFITFAAADGLSGEVPEPASCGMLLAGLGLMGWVVRRKSGTDTRA